MTRAFCIWCETGDGQPKPDMFWIHVSCFEKLTDLQSDIKSVRKRLERGERTPEIVAFLKRMEDFDKRWQKNEKLLERFL